MKTKLAIIAILVVATFEIQSQPLGVVSRSVGETEKRPYEVTGRGPHHRVWTRTTAITNSLGSLQYLTNSYTELATGMHFQRDGQWHETKAEIELTENGAAATNGPHKVFFAANINTVGAVDMTIPDGQRLRSRIFGLSYFDGSNAIIIAETKDSMGLLVSTNQVWYTNAFDDVQADVQYIYTKAGFSQNVILRGQLPSPSDFDLNPAKTRLLILTEFFDPPVPQKKITIIGRTNQLQDEFLKFGQMRIGRGRAFAVGDEKDGGKSVRVAKQWTIIAGRSFLVEEVFFKQVEEQLKSLSKKRQASLSPNRRGHGNTLMAAFKNVLPKRSAKAVGQAMRLAKATMPLERGFVLDYEMAAEDDYFTFRGDTTYYLDDIVNINVPTIEGGAVIKFASIGEAMLNLFAGITCKTAAYLPAIFTVEDDDSVGETIPGSSGTPTTGYAVVNFFPESDYQEEEMTGKHLLENVRFSYLAKGLNIYVGNSYESPVVTTVRNAQFNQCDVALKVEIYNAPEYVSAFLRNILVSDCGKFLAGPLGSETNEMGCIVSGEHVTVHNSDFLTWKDNGFTTLSLTNSLLVNVANWGNFSSWGAIITNHVVFLTGEEGIFEAAGAGYHYLTPNSPYRNAGTIAINSDLHAALKKKTTYPPIVFSNITTSVDTTVWPQAQRDIDLPDLGYHYDPLDYLVGMWQVTNCNLTVKAGTAIGWYNASGAGIWLREGSAINSIGEPTSPNWITHYTSVQEQPVKIGDAAFQYSLGVNGYHEGSPAPNAQFRFTRFTTSAGGYGLYHDTPEFAFGSLSVRDCEFWNGNNLIGGDATTTASFQNNLFHRAAINAAVFSAPNTLSFSNNLVLGTSVFLMNFNGSKVWNFHDNAFDNCSFTLIGSPNPANSHNAYINCAGQLSSSSGGDVVLSNFTYAAGPLGNFYHYSTDLIDVGSIGDSALMGLGHYTSKTDQEIEGNSNLNIGYHYVAVDENGIPLDEDGDGVPNYWEDRNGDGIVDSGETHWYDPHDLGLKVVITKPKRNSVVP